MGIRSSVKKSGYKFNNTERMRGKFMNNELKNIRFNLTNKMTNNFIEILVIEQMIKEKKYKNEFELKLMIEYKNHLTQEYITEFRSRNKKQIKQYTDIMNK